MVEALFLATLHMLPISEGGRAAPFRAGFRPQCYVDSPEESTSFLIHAIIGADQLAPGETGAVEAMLLQPEILGNPLAPGTQFKLREGGRLIGHGTVKKLL